MNDEHTTLTPAFSRLSTNYDRNSTHDNPLGSISGNLSIYLSI
jgi:hypothetical protein